ncbi:MAG: hypothetical protein J7642_18720 [Cyanobacteria bacterium SBC]|nr:hypothetical protein [Cyanobacteria bacterium SBC]
MWDTAVKIALVGTQRQTPQFESDDARIARRLDRSSDGDASLADAERTVLQVAAIETLRRRAGKVFSRFNGDTPTASFKDELPLPSAPTPEQWQELFDRVDVAELLPPCWALAAKTGVRLPDELLPALLDLGKTHRNLRSIVISALGRRGRWLARQNPRWDYATTLPDTTQIDRSWQLGTTTTRLFLLQRLRETQPSRGRDLLASTWNQDKATDRSEFLKTFAVGLSDADEPFLEAALDNKSKQVRAIAADLLARLPNSALCQRTLARIRQSIEIRQRGNRLDLNVTLPKSCPKAALRDGIDSKKLKKAKDLGERSGWLLQQLALVPPRVWSVEISPQKLVERASQSDWKPLLLEGWAVATTRHPDVSWAEALLETVEDIPANLCDADDRNRALLASLSIERREDFVLRHWFDRSQPLGKSHPTLSLLQACCHPWRDPFARSIVDRFCREIATGKDNYNWALRSTFQTFAYRISPNLLPEVANQLTTVTPPGSYWEQTVNDFLDILTFRREWTIASEQPSIASQGS